MVLVAGCGAMSTVAGCSTAKSYADWDRRVDFSSYHTFGFIHEHAIDAPELQTAFERAIAVELENLGMRNDPDDPELMIAVFGEMSSGKRITVWSYSYDPWWGPWGGIIAPLSVDTGTLVLDMVDADSNRLVYRSVLSGILRDQPNKIVKRIFWAVDKLMAEFPPPPSTRT